MRGTFGPIFDAALGRLIRVTDSVAVGDPLLLRGQGRQLRADTQNITEAERQGADLLERTPTVAVPYPTTPFRRRFPRYQPSEAERDMRTRFLVSEDPRTKLLPKTSNGVYIMRDSRGRLNVYKPAAGEVTRSKRTALEYGFDWIPLRPGELAKREVAGYRVFELLGFDRVPPTALGWGPLGPGSIQQFVPLKPGKRADEYDEIQQQQAAVGHYIIGNADGHNGNFRPRDDGDPRHQDTDDLVIFDLGFSFPESGDPSRGDVPFSLKSPFVVSHDGDGLGWEIRAAVDAVDPERLGSALEDLRLSDNAIDHALRRLDHVQTTGTVDASDLPYYGRTSRWR